MVTAFAILAMFPLRVESGIFPKNVREVAWAAVSETTGPVLSVLVLFGKS